MTDRQEQIVKNVDKHEKEVLEAERFIWAHPQTGYTEWEANDYLAVRFEALGYELNRAGNIPGFVTDIDTGKPGPMLAIMGELDALDIANHPESVNGMTHACGHHCQASGMLAVAAALKEPGALDGLSGKIRLMLVPAEEMIQLEFREELRQKGIIKYNGGKPEFMYRGFFDGVDLAIMVHTEGGEKAFCCGYGMNGCIAKTIVYKGKSSHAGGSPEAGINAQYAAMLGLQACNDLRETLRDQDMVRFHPILKGVKSAVNIIPDEMRIESYVRANDLNVIRKENEKFNRALAGAAFAMGARVELHDRPGYAPEWHDKPFMQLVEQCCVELAGRDNVDFDYTSVSGGSSDFGDVTCVMPGIQFGANGAAGTAHGIDYHIVDPKSACLGSAKAELFVAEALLSDGGEKAYEIIKNYKPKYPSIEAYLAALDELTLDKEAVVYGEDGSVTIDYKN